MNVSIVIPNWNGEQKLKKNLPKVLDCQGVREVIVVDDASTDSSIELMEEKFPVIKLIKNSKNLGFAPTVNKGVKEAVGDLVFLLNSDAVPEYDCLKNVKRHFLNPRVFSVGFNSGGNWSWGYFKDGYFWHYQAKVDSNLKTHQTLWASGGSGIFRKAVWEKMGGLDELYAPFYEEDLDLGYRATKRGYINLWEPKAVVEHYKQKGVIAENFSKDFVSRIAQRNQLFFIWKNITDQELIKSHKKALLAMCLKHPKYSLVVLAALKRLSQIKQAREIEEKDQILDDLEILRKYPLKPV